MVILLAILTNFLWNKDFKQSFYRREDTIIDTCQTGFHWPSYYFLVVIYHVIKDNAVYHDAVA